ncbi:MAG: hypothetical protein OJI67_16845, partial [Prosthecobacter sp.]|nr:hypothetical protein [Prosthecobacter sp.]
ADVKEWFDGSALEKGPRVQAFDPKPQAGVAFDQGFAVVSPKPGFEAKAMLGSDGAMPWLSAMAGFPNASGGVAKSPEMKLVRPLLLRGEPRPAGVPTDSTVVTARVPEPKPEPKPELVDLVDRSQPGEDRSALSSGQNSSAPPMLKPLEMAEATGNGVLRPNEQDRPDKWFEFQEGKFEMKEGGPKSLPSWAVPQSREDVQQILEEKQKTAGSEPLVSLAVNARRDQEGQGRVPIPQKNRPGLPLKSPAQVPNESSVRPGVGAAGVEDSTPGAVPLSPSAPAQQTEKKAPVTPMDYDQWARDRPSPDQPISGLQELPDWKEFEQTGKVAPVYDPFGVGQKGRFHEVPEELRTSPQGKALMMLEQGLPPAEVARRLQSDMKKLEAMTDGDDPAAVWKGSVRLDNDMQQALEAAKSAAVKSVLEDWQKRTGLPPEQLIEAYTGDKGALPTVQQQELEKSLRGVFDDPAFKVGSERHYTGKVMAGGASQADYTMRQRGEGKVDVFFTLPNGKTRRAEIAAVSDAEMQSELGKSKASLNEISAKEKSIQEELDKRKAYKVQVEQRKYAGSGARMPEKVAHDIAQIERNLKATQEKRMELEGDLKILMVRGKRALLDRRVMEEVRKPEWRDEIGTYDGWAEVGKGGTSAILGLGTMYATAIGDEKMQREMAEANANLDLVMGGSTRRELEGGWWNDVVINFQRGVGEELVYLPLTLATGGTATRGAKVLAKEAVKKGLARHVGKETLANIAQGVGGSLLDTNGRILEAEAAGNKEEAKRLKDGKWMRAILSTASGMAADKLNPLRGRLTSKANPVAQNMASAIADQTVIDPATIGQGGLDLGQISAGVVGSMGSSHFVNGVTPNHSSGEPLKKEPNSTIPPVGQYSIEGGGYVEYENAPSQIPPPGAQAWAQYQAGTQPGAAAPAQPGQPPQGNAVTNGEPGLDESGNGVKHPSVMTGSGTSTSQVPDPNAPVQPGVPSGEGTLPQGGTQPGAATPAQPGVPSGEGTLPQGGTPLGAAAPAQPSVPTQGNAVTNGEAGFDASGNSVKHPSAIAGSGASPSQVPDPNAPVQPGAPSGEGTLPQGGTQPGAATPAQPGAPLDPNAPVQPGAELGTPGQVPTGAPPGQPLAPGAQPPPLGEGSPATENAPNKKGNSGAPPPLPPPPLWKGPSITGETVEILDRNEDGSFEVRRANGEVRTFKESDVARMTGMKKVDMDAFIQQKDLLGDNQPSATGGLSIGETHAEPGKKQRLVDRITQQFDRLLPGFLGADTHIFQSAQDLLNSDYAREHPFTPEQVAEILGAEGFHDPNTGKSFVIVDNVRPREGESARRAMQRVIAHEGIGHGGVNRLLDGNETARKRFDYLMGRIRQMDPEGLRALAADPAYAHLQGDPRGLALEWLARESERRPELLKERNLLTAMRAVVGQAISDMLVKLGVRVEGKADLDRHVDIFLQQARQAALNRSPEGQRRLQAGARQDLQFSRRQPGQATVDFRERQTNAHLAEGLIREDEQGRAANDAALSVEQRLQKLTELYPHATPQQQQEMQALATQFDPAEGLSLESKIFQRLGRPGAAQTFTETQKELGRLAPISLSPSHHTTPAGVKNDREVHNGQLGNVQLEGEWWKGQAGQPNTNPATGGAVKPFRSPVDAVRPHLAQIVREGHIARTRMGLDGEREHLLTHPVTINGQTHIAMAVARARADGTLVVEPGMVKVYTPSDFQRVMENDNVSDNLIELPGSVEDYGGVEQRDSLLNMVNRS